MAENEYFDEYFHPLIKPLQVEAKMRLQIYSRMSVIHRLFEKI